MVYAKSLQSGPQNHGVKKEVAFSLSLLEPAQKTTSGLYSSEEISFNCL
jgi:hypothetical protein